MGRLVLLLSLSVAVAAQAAEPRKTFNACLAEMVTLLGPPGDLLAETPSMDRNVATRAVHLTTARLSLGTPRRADMADLLPIFRHGPTVKFTWFDWGDDFWSLRRVGMRYETFAEKALLGLRHDFMIRAHEGNVLVGRCALYEGVGPGSWEFGITLHEPYWGRRYAAEVIEEIFRYVFVDLRGTEVRFRTEPEHEKMLKQYERLGIPKVIDEQDDNPEPPTYHRYHHFALSREAWCRTHRCP